MSDNNHDIQDLLAIIRSRFADGWPPSLSAEAAGLRPPFLNRPGLDPDPDPDPDPDGGGCRGT